MMAGITERNRKNPKQNGLELVWRFLSIGLGALEVIEVPRQVASFEIVSARNIPNFYDNFLSHLVFPCHLLSLSRLLCSSPCVFVILHVLSAPFSSGTWKRVQALLDDLVRMLMSTLYLLLPIVQLVLGVHTVFVALCLSHLFF